MDIRVVLLPEKDLENQVKIYSRKISEKITTLFLLDDQHLPHVTLLHMEINEEQLSAIHTIVQKLAEKTEKIAIELENIKSDDGEYIGVYFSENSKVMAVKEVLQNELTNIGVRGDNPFLPHITLTRLMNKQELDVLNLILETFPKRDFTLNQIAICEQGANGTCKNILKKVTLH